MVHLLLTWTLLASGADLDGAVDGLQKRYASITAIAGEFTQTYKAPGIEQRESGRFWLKKPGLMRWEYRDPETKLFIADGKETSLYVPGDRQVMVRRFTAEELQATPLRFLFGRGEIRRAYEIREEREIQPLSPGSVLARLVPREADSEYSFLVLEIDSASFELLRLLVRERGGNTAAFQFRALEMNPRVDAGMFRFRIPKGVEVIRQDEK